MLISEIIHSLKAWCPINCENRSDVPVYGDMSKDAATIAVCTIATPEVLRRAKELGADLLITHEPTFHDAITKHSGYECLYGDPVYQAKKKLISELNIPIFRFHDHSHFTEIDKIHAGFVKALGLPGEFDGQKTFGLQVPLTVNEIEQYLQSRLDLHHIRFVGQRNKIVKRIALCAGAWGDQNLYEQLNRPGIDLVICGEICEWSICEYVRDAAQLGLPKALFILGHMGSERSGMAYVCDHINETMSGVNAVYIDCGEVYNR